MALWRRKTKIDLYQEIDEEDDASDDGHAAESHAGRVVLKSLQTYFLLNYSQKHFHATFHIRIGVARCYTYLHAKNPYFGVFLKGLGMKKLVYFWHY
jgi:hypothetical protein